MNVRQRAGVRRRNTVTVTLATLILLATVAGNAWASELRIVGPDRADVADEVRLVVDGLATPPAGSTLADVQQWAARLVLTVDAPDGSEPIADAELSLGLGSGLRLRVYLTPDKPGIYVLVLIDPAVPAVATHRITAGAVTPPGPTPGPGPQPGPGPVEVTKAVILHETSEQTQEMATLILALRQGPLADRLHAAGRSVLILDKDQQSAASYREQLADQPLPAVLLFDGGGNLVGRHPLPEDAAAVLRLMGG